MALSNENRISLPEFRDFLMKPIIEIDELEDYDGQPLKKVLSEWRRNELVPFIPRGTWIKVSFADLIWFKILDTLRSLGYPVEKMKNVADYFFKDAYRDDLPEINLKKNISFLKKKEFAGTINDDEKEMLEQMQVILDDKYQIHIIKFKLNYLTNLIDEVLNTGEDREILVFPDGSIGELHGGEPRSHRKNKFNPLKPHIRLSLKEMFEEFVRDEDLSTIHSTALDAAQRKVLHAIKGKGAREIIIRFDDNEDLQIQKKKKGLIKGDNVKKLRTLLALENYEDIILKSVDSKTISFEKIKKK